MRLGIKLHLYKGSGQQSSDWEDGGQGSCISTGSEGGQQALMACDESQSPQGPVHLTMRLHWELTYHVADPQLRLDYCPYP